MLMFPVRSVMIAAVACVPYFAIDIAPAESVAINLTRKERAKSNT